MKVRDIPAFQQWLSVMFELDPRLDGRDFNTLFKVWRNSK